jgi:hypothetical protein
MGARARHRLAVRTRPRAQILPNTSPLNPSAAAGGDTRPASRYSAAFSTRPMRSQRGWSTERSRSSTAASGQLSFVSRTAFWRNTWLPSTRSTLPRAPTEPSRSPFPNGSLPKKSPPRGYSLSTTRSHNCQPASADPGAWTSARWGRAGRGDCPQVLGSDHRRPTGISRRCSPIRFFRHPSAANADLVQAEPAQPLGRARSPRADPSPVAKSRP